MIKKKIIATFSVVLLLSLAIQAQKNEKLEFVKERMISKTYPAAGNSLLIENSFGDIKVITWDKNEIKVDVAIKVESNDQESAEKTFENIDVKDGEAGNKVRFKTEIANNNNHSGCKKCRTNMKINYEVRIPVTLTLTLKNTFGAIEVPDYKGSITISNKFGKVTAGVLADAKDVDIEFGKGELKGLSDVNVSFKFSQIQVENLVGANKIKMEFCDSSKIVLGSTLSSLTFHESYSTVNLKPAQSLGATYSIKTSFGTIVDRSEIGLSRTDTPERYGPDSNRTYAGKSGNGSAKIDISSSFGKIIVGDAKPDDLKKTSKSQSRHSGKVI